MNRLVITLSFLLALAGCDSDPDTDAGTTGDVDAGPGGDVDSGPGGDTDSGPGDVDSGPGDVDSGPGDMDAGPGDSDAGPGDTDAGPGDSDAGPGSGGTVGAAPIDLTAGYSETLNGDTTGGTTWARPIVASDCPATSRSSSGTAVEYQEQVVHNMTGAALTVTVSTSASYDAYLIVYTGATHPSDELMCLVGDDNSGGGSDPMLSFTLGAGESAIIVATGFSNGDTGAYTMSLSAS